MIQKIHSLTVKSPWVLIHIQTYLHEIDYSGTHNKTNGFWIKTMVREVPGTNNNNRGSVKETIVKIRQKRLSNKYKQVMGSRILMLTW